MMQRCLTWLCERADLLKRLFFVLVAVIALADLLVPRHALHFAGDRIPGFWSLFGLAGCIGMVLVCKLVSRLFLSRGEEYYDNE